MIEDLHPFYLKYQGNHFIFFKMTFHAYFAFRDHNISWNWGFGDWLIRFNDVLLYKNLMVANKPAYIVHCKPIGWQSIRQKNICKFIGNNFFCNHLIIDYDTKNVTCVTTAKEVDSKTQNLLLQYSDHLYKSNYFDDDQNFSTPNRTLKLFYGLGVKYKIFAEWEKLLSFEQIRHVNNNAKMPKKNVSNNFFLNFMYENDFGLYDKKLRLQLTHCMKRCFEKNTKDQFYYPSVVQNFEIIPYSFNNNTYMDLEEVIQKVLSSYYVIGPEGGIYHLACYVYKPYIMILPDNLLKLPITLLESAFGYMTEHHKDYCHIFVFEKDFENFYNEYIKEIEFVVNTWPQKSNIYLNLKQNKNYYKFFKILKKIFSA